jgi:hypothetical protein
MTIELLTVEEIAARFKVKPSFFYAPARRKGENAVPCSRVGKYLRYDPDAVKVWLERQSA